MTSIKEAYKGLNGDGWGTTITKEEQLAHENYIKNFNFNSYDKTRDKNIKDRQTELNKQRITFNDDILYDKKDKYIDDDIYEEINNLKNHQKVLLESIENLKKEIKNLNDKLDNNNKPGFIRRIYRKILTIFHW